MPALRKRESDHHRATDALDAELHDAETYLKLAENLEGFLARLAQNAQNLTIEERQRVVNSSSNKCSSARTTSQSATRSPPPQAPMTQLTCCVGAVASPLLSNIYLTVFDERMAEAGFALTRVRRRLVDRVPFQIGSGAGAGERPRSAGR